jgi:hypothetical protein
VLTVKGKKPWQPMVPAEGSLAEVAFDGNRSFIDSRPLRGRKAIMRQSKKGQWVRQADCFGTARMDTCPNGIPAPDVLALTPDNVFLHSSGISHGFFKVLWRRDRGTSLSFAAGRLALRRSYLDGDG